MWDLVVQLVELNTPRLNLPDVINTKGPFVKLLFGQLVRGCCTNMAIKHVDSVREDRKGEINCLPVIQYLWGDASILNKPGHPYWTVHF